jgi:hypothetical protein
MNELEALLTRLDDAARRVGKGLEAPSRLTEVERQQADSELAHAGRQAERAKEAIRALFLRERTVVQAEKCSEAREPTR